MTHLLKQNRMGIHIATRLSLFCLPVWFSEWPELELSPPVSSRAQPRSAKQLLLICPESCFNYKVLPRFIVSSQSGVAQGTMAHTGLPSSGSTYERSWAHWCWPRWLTSHDSPLSHGCAPTTVAPFSTSATYLPPHTARPPSPDAPSMAHSSSVMSQLQCHLLREGGCPCHRADLVLPAKSTTTMLPCSLPIAQVVTCHLPGLHAPQVRDGLPRKQMLRRE